MGTRTAAVVNYFLDKGRQDGVDLSPMKLQKLIYFAHGWNLAIYNKPLIDEAVEAWEWGPVISSVYHDYKKYGRDAITSPSVIIDPSGDWQLPNITDERTRALLDRVWEQYGRLTPVQLSNMTHLPGTPWDTVKKDNKGDLGKWTVIDDDLIRDYFKRAVRERSSS